MLWNLLVFIVVILLILWVLGFVFSFGGGLIHILIVVAIVLAIIWLVQRVRVRK